MALLSICYQNNRQSQVSIVLCEARIYRLGSVNDWLASFYDTSHWKFTSPSKKNTLILYILAALIIVVVIANPNGNFVLPMNGGYIERYYGPIFWLLIIFLTTSVMISLYIIYSALVSNTTQRIKKQVAHVLKGVLVLTVFILLDVFLNVVLLKSDPVIPGLTSLGILISAIFS